MESAIEIEGSPVPAAKSRTLSVGEISKASIRALLKISSRGSASDFVWVQPEERDFQ